jgi:hypothetical protein
MLRDDPTGNYASMAQPLVVTPASVWMGRTMMLAEAWNRSASAYLYSNMVVIITTEIIHRIYEDYY